MTLRIERYKNTRPWALYDGPELVVVTVYRRGALEVLQRLQAQEPPEAAAPPARRGATPRPAGAPPSGAPPAAWLCTPARFSGQAAATDQRGAGAVKAASLRAPAAQRRARP